MAQVVEPSKHEALRLNYSIKRKKKKKRIYKEMEAYFYKR
jgi:hypothetical protein